MLSCIHPDIPTREVLPPFPVLKATPLGYPGWQPRAPDVLRSRNNGRRYRIYIIYTVLDAIYIPPIVKLTKISIPFDTSPTLLPPSLPPTEATTPLSSTSSALPARPDAVLDAAALAYTEGLRAGVREDELLAAAMGATSVAALSAVQEEYKEKFRQKLIQRAEDIKKRVLPGQKEFEAGKVLYERGRYTESVEVFRSALTIQGESSTLGGDIQMWLALALQACGEEEECIIMCKMIEQTHPNRKIRAQVRRQTRRHSVDLVGTG